MTAVDAESSEWMNGQTYDWTGERPTDQDWGVGVWPVTTNAGCGSEAGCGD
jgi:hypothetical protein